MKKIITASSLLMVLFITTAGWCAGKGESDEYDKKYTYRGGTFANPGERKQWDVVNKELADQERSHAAEQKAIREKNKK